MSRKNGNLFLIGISIQYTDKNDERMNVPSADMCLHKPVEKSEKKTITKYANTRNYKIE